MRNVWDTEALMVMVWNCSSSSVVSSFSVLLGSDPLKRFTDSLPAKMSQNLVIFISLHQISLGKTVDASGSDSVQQGADVLCSPPLCLESALKNSFSSFLLTINCIYPACAELWRSGLAVSTPAVAPNSPYADVILHKLRH